MVYFILLGKKTINLIKLCKFNIFIFFGLFIILTSLFYKTNYSFLIHAMEAGSQESYELAGYFGAFIFGKNTLVLNEVFVENLKNLINNHEDFYSIINFIHQGLITNGFNFYFLNIFPSLFGFYQYTLDKADISNNVFNILFLGILNIMIAFNFVRNIKNILFSNDNFRILIKSSIIVFLTLSAYFLYQSAIWSIIKLYFYFSFFIIIITILIFKKDHTSFNYPFFLLLIIFPIFFYTGIKEGIGRVNSFPSIIDRQMKENFSWNLNLEKIKQCNSILIQEQNKIKKKYLVINTFFNDKKIIFDGNKKNYNCKISSNNFGFNINYINN